MSALAKAALEEDLGAAGDITSASVISEPSSSTAEMVVREPGVVCGLALAETVFHEVDGALDCRWDGEGERRGPGEVVMTVAGATRAILTAERSALNLAARASGVATATARFVDAVAGTGARISDTRKTMPGLRVLDKYAVRVGGGVNHRMGLHDAVMIKDNHIVAAGDIADAVAMARAAVGPDVMIEVEVDRLSQIPQVLDSDADRILLDNMDSEALAAAVELCARLPRLESTSSRSAR